MKSKRKNLSREDIAAQITQEMTRRELQERERAAHQARVIAAKVFNGRYWIDSRGRMNIWYWTWGGVVEDRLNAALEPYGIRVHDTMDWLPRILWEIEMSFVDPKT